MPRCLVLAALAAVSSFTSAATFIPLDLPGSQLSALSTDGCVAAGGVLGGSPAGFRWTVATGAEPLNDAIAIHALSPSGTFAAGSTLDAMQREVAAYWDATGAVHRLASMPGLETIGTISQAHAIADGPYVVGSARRPDGVRLAFEWSAATGMRELAPEQHADESRAIAISSDGRLVGGWARHDGRVRPLRWRDGRLLPMALEGESRIGEILGGSRDAGTLVGWLGRTAVVYRGADVQRLTADNAVVRLQASSDDGKLLVGDSGNGDEREAWVWLESEGFVSLADLLVRRRVSIPPDWRPLALTTVSADGQRLGGWGKHAGDRLDSFIVDLGGSDCANAAKRTPAAP